MKILLVCHDRFQAEVIKGNLENGGFHPVVFDNVTQSVYAGYVTRQQVTVRIPEEEYEAARQWLAMPVEEI